MRTPKHIQAATEKVQGEMPITPIRQMPVPTHTYTEIGINTETGEEYSYEVKVFAPAPNPFNGLNPAYNYGGKGGGNNG